MQYCGFNSTAKVSWILEIACACDGGMCSAEIQLSLHEMWLFN